MAGIIIEVISDENFLLKDFNEKEWKIDKTLAFNYFPDNISVFIDILSMAECCKNSAHLRQVVGLADMLKVISDPNRLKILCLLKSGTRCVCEIQKVLKLKQNLVSHHLRVMKDAELLVSEKTGLWHHYSLNSEVVNKYKNIFNQLLT